MPSKINTKKAKSETPSDSLDCPIDVKNGEEFLSKLAAPARRALLDFGINSLDKLAEYTKKEILQLHGMGKTSLPKLQAALAEKGLSFKVQNEQVTTEKIAGGVVHELPEELKNLLLSNPDILAKWNNLTPLARNEWICWLTIPKKQETRDEHLKQLCQEIREGQKRPCCWPGCPHRNPKSQKWFKKPQ